VNEYISLRQCKIGHGHEIDSCRRIGLKNLNLKHDISDSQKTTKYMLSCMYVLSCVLTITYIVFYIY
jgi:hypothetical protein